MGKIPENRPLTPPFFSKSPIFALKMPCKLSPGWGLITAPQKQPGIAASISAAAISAFLVGWTVAAAADFEESILRRCATGNLFGPSGPLPGHWRSGAKAAQIRVLRRKQQSSFFYSRPTAPFYRGSVSHRRQTSNPLLTSGRQPYSGERASPGTVPGAVRDLNPYPNRHPVASAGQSRLSAASVFP